jgi:succinate dehydrogenase/fumarate reductase flavoprotein subunit
MEAMKSFNSYIIETKVIANMIEIENSEEEMSETLEKIEILKSEFKEFVKISDQTRPG